MRALFFGITMVLLMTGCQSLPKPGLSLKEAKLVEGPVLIQRGSHFYLRYRRALEPQRMTLLSVLYSKQVGDAAYYYFSCPISHMEWGQLVERPLAYDGYEHLAKLGQVFWLEPDGTRHRIPIQEEKTE
jgi:hypothetical protein